MAGRAGAISRDVRRDYAMGELSMVSCDGCDGCDGEKGD